MPNKKPARAKPAALTPLVQPTCPYRVIALDPSVRAADGAVLTALIEIPNEELAPGPRGYRVQVIDYDASNRILYRPAPYQASDLLKVVTKPEKDRAFQARNVYAIVMRVLARFERALGRRVRWSFPGHQLTIAPHAFQDLNAFYSKEDRAIFFGYYPGDSGMVFTCLSHEVVAHETTHALVDGLRDGYLRPSSPDQAAFHEGIADIVALFSVLSLREVVSAGLDLGTSGKKDLVKASLLTEKALKQGVLLGLAQQVGETMYGTHGVALRRSIELPVSPKLAASEEFSECHRRGELLVVNLADQHGGSDRADRNIAGFRAADAVEDVHFVAGCQDAVERGLGRAHNADAAHQFVRPPVYVYPVDHQRNHLEGLRRTPRSDGEAGGDVLEVQPIGLALLLRLIDQHLPQLAFRHGFRRGDDEIALASGGHVSCFGASVAVALGDAGDGQARHQEGLQHAVLDEIDAPRGLTLVVKVVMAAERSALEIR